LNSHSQITAFGELFRDADKIGWDMPIDEEISKSSNLLSLRKQDPARFLERVFNMFAPLARVIGFKIFYYHAESNNALLQYLQRQTELKVIHLKRQNTLRQPGHFLLIDGPTQRGSRGSHFRCSSNTMNVSRNFNGLPRHQKNLTATFVTIHITR